MPIASVGQPVRVQSKYFISFFTFFGSVCGMMFITHLYARIFFPAKVYEMIYFETFTSK